MGVRYQKYRSIAIPLNIGIELSQVSRYFDIFGIEPALVCVYSCACICSYVYTRAHDSESKYICLSMQVYLLNSMNTHEQMYHTCVFAS